MPAMVSCCGPLIFKQGFGLFSSLYGAESCSSWSPYFTASEFSTGDCYRYFGLPVRAVYGEVVPVAEITLPETLILTMGIKESETLTASFLPDNATYKNLTWVSSDISIATVDAKGTVTAVTTSIVCVPPSLEKRTEETLKAFWQDDKAKIAKAIAMILFFICLFYI